MKKSRLSYEKVFIIALSVLCLINSLVFVSCVFAWFNKIAILFAFWAFPVLFYKFFYKTEYIFRDRINIIGFLFALISLVSLFVNKFICPVENVYAIIAFLINFFIIYDYSASNSVLSLKKVFFIIYITCLFYTILSLVTLYFKISVSFATDTVGNYRYLGIDSGNKRFCGLLGNPNNLARAVMSGLISSFFLYIITDRKIYRLLLLLSNFIYIYVMALTQSRAAIYCMIFGFLVFTFITLIFKIKSEKNKLKILKLIFLFLISNFIFMFGYFKFESYAIKHILYYPENKVVSETQSAVAEDVVADRREIDGRINDFTTGRLDIWKICINAVFLEKPFFGFTHGNVKNSFYEFINKNNMIYPNYIAHVMGNMHNQFLQFLSEYGIFAFFFIVYLYFYVIKLIIKIIVKTNNDSVCDKRIVLFISILSSLALYSMVETVFFLFFDNEVINIVLLLVLGCFIRTVKDLYGDEILKDKLLDKISIGIIKIINLIKSPFTRNKQINK